jgi:hypothetical protein
MAGAVHRLERVVPVLRLRREHVLPVLLPVTRGLPQRAIEDLRCLDLAIAAVAIHLPHVLLDRLPQRPAARVPEDEPRGFVLPMKQIEFLAQAPVVALFGFLEHRQVGVLLLLLRPCRAVDALEHLVLAVAAPVRAGKLHQLEDLELAGVRHMRTATQVDEAAFPVQRDVLSRRNRTDDLGLVLLADRLEVLDGVVTIQTSRRTGSSFFASSAIFFSMACRSSGVNGRL